MPDSKKLWTDAQRAEWLLAELDDYIAKPEVRGVVEPPTFRFSGAFPASLHVAGCGYGHTRPVGGGADIGNRCEHGVLPEVVGLPLDGLVEQVRLGSLEQRRHRQDSEPEFVLVSATERAVGQEPIRYPLEGHRIGPAGPTPVQRVGA